MKTLIILTLCLLFSTSTFCQDSTFKLLVYGKWTLAKHTATKNGTTYSERILNRVSVYEFFKDGTYKLLDRYKTDQYQTKGKWKVIEGGKKVHLYNNVDIPDKPDIEIADHDLNVTKISGEYFLSYSSGDTPNPPETDYYKKKN